MELKELGGYIRYLDDTENHLTALLGGKRGSGKTYTTYNLAVTMEEDYAIKSHWFQHPKDIYLDDVQLLIWDDAGPWLYKRDAMKTPNKKVAKTLQRLRGAVPMLLINVVDIERLDIDLRTDFGVHGQIIKHGYIEIEGVVIGPIPAKAKPPSDVEIRKEEVLAAFESLAD